MIKQVAVAVWCVAVIVALSCGRAGAAVLDELNSEISRLVKAAAPSVVEISGGDRAAATRVPEAGDWSQLFKDSTEKLYRMQVAASAQSVGSGFVIDEAGYILTTSDVAESDKVTVKFADGTQADGKVVGRDNVTNAAVIKVEKSGLNPLPLGDSAGLDVGNLVICVNNQAGLANSVSLGIIAGLDRKMDDAQDLIQVSGTIGPGASGGPVLDSRGRVVGITFAMLSPSPSALPFNYPKIIIGSAGTPEDVLRSLGGEGMRAAAVLEVSQRQARLKKAEANKEYCEGELSRLLPRHQWYGQLKHKAADAEADLESAKAELEAAVKGLDLLKNSARPFAEDFLQAAKLTTRTSGSSGFAIPINRIKPILDALKAGREIERGWLGAMMGEKDGKIIFKELEKGSPAEEAGLEAGDVLVSADGKRFDEMRAFTSYVPTRKPGEVIKIIVSRESNEREVNVKLGKRPTAAETKQSLFARAVKRSTFSLSVEDAGIAEVARKLSDASGVSVIVSEPEKIKKKVTVNLKSTTVEKALDVICRTLGCQYKKDGDAYVISPK